MVNGGLGIDTATYIDHSTDVVANLDGSANDGTGCVVTPALPQPLSCEGDTIKTDIENLHGGSGNDTLTGNTAANLLNGGLGDEHAQGRRRHRHRRLLATHRSTSA